MRLPTWLRQSALCRRPPLALAVGLIIYVTLATFALAFGVQHYVNFDTTADRLAAEALVFGVGTFAIAIVAGLLALQAFASSLRAPQLELTVWLTFQVESVEGELPPQRAVQAASDPTSTPDRDLWALPESVLRIFVTNEGDATARNVYVLARIEPRHAHPVVGAAPGWSLLPSAHSDGPELRLEWEGGVDFALHPDVPRWLPTVPFEPGHITPCAAIRVRVQLVADSCRPLVWDQEVVVTPP